jgi:hypothetical protein
MNKIKQIKIPMNIDYTWKLVRERDGLTHLSNDIGWIEWNESGRFKQTFNEPSINRSLILDPYKMVYTWLTTPITEIVDQKEDYVKFKTENSIYELFKLK